MGVLKVSAVTYGKFDPNAYKVVTNPEEFARLSINPTSETIIVSRANSLDLVGASAYITQDYPHIFLPDKLWKLTTTSKYCAMWLGYVLASRPIRALISARATGTSGSMKNIAQEAFLSIRIVAPPLAEQRKIAAILSVWDEAIAATEKLIAALRARKKALMQRLLTGRVRHDWEMTRLSEIAEILVSNVDKKSQPEEQTVRLCNYMDVFYQNYITNSMQFMEATASQREIDKFALKKHDVILTKDSETVADIAQVAVVDEELSNVVCGYHLAILRPNHEIVFGPFLRELLTIPDIHRQFEDAANGVTRFGLTLSAIHNIGLPLPPLAKQKESSEVLRICDQQINTLRQYASELQSQKKGLMQRLLTGQVRVSVSME